MSNYYHEVGSYSGKQFRSGALVVFWEQTILSLKLFVTFKTKRLDTRAFIANL